MEIGPRDIAEKKAVIARRDQPVKMTESLLVDQLIATIAQILDNIQENLYNKALTFRKSHLHRIDDKEQFYQFFTPKNQENPEIHGGFALCHWCEDPRIEEQVKNDLSVTIRCIPLDQEKEEGICPFSGKKSPRRVIFAKSY